MKRPTILPFKKRPEPKPPPKLGLQIVIDAIKIRIVKPDDP